jgi:hypothetical protein
LYPFEEINDKEFGPTHLYAWSKLATILCAKFMLPEKVFKKNGDHSYSLSVQPGYRQYQHAAAMERCIPRPFRENAVLGYDDCRKGHRTGSCSALWAATSPEIVDNDLQGHYFVDPVRSGSIAA